ncbi:MAG: HAD family hydrolase [Saccharofermentanales bacterium]
MNKVLFWDFDGTLVHSNSLWSNSVFSVLQRACPDCPASFENIRFYMKEGFTWHTPESDFAHLTDDRWWEFMVARFSHIYQQFGIPGSEADRIARLVKPEILHTENYTLYDDAIPILETSVKRGYRNLIVSNNYPELQEVMAGLDLADYFEDFIISGKVGYDKPRKEIFDIALQSAGYPDQCFMIGDNPIADIFGANQAGIRSVLVHSRPDGCGLPAMNGVEVCADFTFEHLYMIEEVL